MQAIGTASSLDSTAASDQLRQLRRAATTRRSSSSPPPVGAPVGGGWTIRGEPTDAGSTLVAIHESGQRVELATTNPPSEKNGDQ